MSDHSAIEWTDATWNPTVGCSIVSPGCTNCYAMKVADGLQRRFNSKKYAGLTKTVNGNAVWTGEVRLDESALLQPLKWRKPKRIFVNSMSDLFHESLSDAAIDKVFGVMALCPQHTFQVLTKRAERMRHYLTSCNRDGIEYEMDRIAPAHWRNRELQDYGDMPLKNVWLGVSCERQEEADERIPHLLQTPAAVRFVSAEPLLGPIDLWNGDPDPRLGGHKATHTFLGDWWEPGDNPKGPSRHGVDWVIVGGESGARARPMHPDWARSLRDQCAAAEVPFFFKQWGEFLTDDGYPGESHRVGKKAAGRLLDGVEHNEFPRVS
ncbi:MAG: phage Gp37/Gp68 family protein [Anaerolineaceae bacterium]|nr:MAG: phage Gp37/Gp68 family protein [Anaerolineaceae bacterium]